MEAVNIANTFEEAYEEYERESPPLLQSVMLEKRRQSEEDPLGLCMGLKFALPVSLLIWGMIIWVFI
jgi:hypothetical protein